MSSERARRLREAAQKAEEQAMERAAQGELGHLQGKALDLSDDSPNWYLNKLLKREGFSHPLIERGRDVDRVQAYVDDLVLRLRARRERLGDPGHSLTVEQARGFNAAREHALEEYREGLHRLNRAIMFHNLGVPEGLHRRPVLIDDAVERLADEIPLLKEPPAPVRLPWQSRLAARLKRLL